MANPGRWSNESLRDRLRFLTGEVQRLTRIALKLKHDLMATAPVLDQLKARAKIMQSVVELLKDEQNWKTEVTDGTERTIWAGPSHPAKIAEEALEDAEKSMLDVQKRYTVRRIVRPGE